MGKGKNKEKKCKWKGMQSYDQKWENAQNCKEKELQICEEGIMEWRRKRKGKELHVGRKSTNVYVMEKRVKCKEINMEKNAILKSEQMFLKEGMSCISEEERKRVMKKKYVLVIGTAGL